MNNVSSRTALLVTDGSFAGGKADDAAARGTRCVHPDEFAILLGHLQPAGKRTAAPPRPRSAEHATVVAAPASHPVTEAATLPAAHVTVSPAAVRAWARTNGYEVGDRGRLPAEIIPLQSRPRGRRPGLTTMRRCRRAARPATSLRPLG
jgi:DNA polymerase-3 subunit epsilon